MTEVAKVVGCAEPGANEVDIVAGVTREAKELDEGCTLLWLVGNVDCIPFPDEGLEDNDDVTYVLEGGIDEVVVRCCVEEERICDVEDDDRAIALTGPGDSTPSRSLSTALSCQHWYPNLRINEQSYRERLT